MKALLLFLLAITFSTTLFAQRTVHIEPGNSVVVSGESVKVTCGTEGVVEECAGSNYYGKYPAGGGCNYYGCHVKDGGCNYYGCYPAGGDCNYYGCFRKGGDCTYSGCVKKYSGDSYVCKE